MTDNIVSDLAVVGFKFRHHGKYSGYDQIVNYLNPSIYLDRGKFDYTTPLLLNIRGGNRVNLFLEKLRDQKFFSELYKICQNPKIKVIHFLYPENTLAFCPFEIPNNKIVIGTFHQPQVYFRDIFTNSVQNELAIKNFRRCNRAIVLGNNELEEFTKITGIKQVDFIPHGLNTIRYKPMNYKRKQNHILFLGNWLRDFECAAGVFTELVRLNPNTKVMVVCNKENHQYFTGIKNVQCLSGISDDHLLMLLQTCSLLFLPLKSATANNAIVEAAACGLPILTTDLLSLEDYITLPTNMKFSLEMHEDYLALAMKILALLGSGRDLEEGGELLAQSSIKLNWELIAKQTEELYIH